MSYNILSLVSNGTVYVDPPCMVGVPVEKVIEGGSYWVSTWTSFGASIQKMEDKLDTYEQNMSQGINIKPPMQPMHALLGLKDYFEAEGFHPNQLLSNAYILGTGLVEVDVLYKLKTIMEDLKEARGVDVIQEQPLAWLRGRLAHIIHKEKSKDTLKNLLQSFETDSEFDSVQSVRDMILGAPGYVRPKPKQIQFKEEEKGSRIKDHNSTSKAQDIKDKAKRDDLRRLHQKIFVPAHVNRHLKARYQAYQESQGELVESFEEEHAGEDSEDDAADGDYVE